MRLSTVHIPRLPRQSLMPRRSQPMHQVPTDEASVRYQTTMIQRGDALFARLQHKIRIVFDEYPLPLNCVVKLHLSVRGVRHGDFPHSRFLVDVFPGDRMAPTDRCGVYTVQRNAADGSPMGSVPPVPLRKLKSDEAKSRAREVVLADPTFMAALGEWVKTNQGNAAVGFELYFYIPL